MKDQKISNTTNVLSVDVEDYFHVEAFAGQIPREQWPSFTTRVEGNVARILDLFERHRANGTFFILGWVAKRFPSLAKEIARRGHEVGCHGFSHSLVQRLTPENFRMDVRDARRLLQDTVSQPVRAYRAPSFSIVRETLWALDVLAEEGFTLDSSIFPVHHDLYGIPDAPRFPYRHRTPRGNSLLEFPPTTLRWMKQNIGIAGGGYLRLIPYAFTRRAIRYVNVRECQSVMVYFHPWEIDAGQPRIAAPLRSRLRHYTNLATMERKLEFLLRDFRFTTLSEACSGPRVFEEHTLGAA
jgi:polysaccharide deacetylase family protein (PEP-CTERM system associated)